ncbi:hypothetical protein [Streptomyces sp. CAU 1734]|uniref:hypothetical protein n=1 Tax=Streptomyces sp. CAU 1734 TaxID=3140360 RepID=UPI00325FFDBE
MRVRNSISTGTALAVIFSSVALVAGASGTAAAGPVPGPSAGGFSAEVLNKPAAGSAGAGGTATESTERRAAAPAKALRVSNDPNKAQTALTVSAPAKAVRGKALTVTGKLTATPALPAGTALTVTRTDLDSPKGKSLGTKTTAANGTFSFKDTPPAGGKVTYRVAYAGSATHNPAAGQDTVEVSRTAVKLSVDRNKQTHKYGASVKFTATLGKTYKNRTVKLYADVAGDNKPRALFKSGKVNSAGKLVGTFKLTRDTSVTAVFDGDSRTANRSVTSTVGTQAKVVTSVARHYRTANIGSTKYHWFTKKTKPLLTTSMNQYPNRSQLFEVQVYSGGQWRAALKEYFPVEGGLSVVELTTPEQAGLKLRMRSSYINGSSGDTVNATVSSAWKYLYFT